MSRRTAFTSPRASARASSIRASTSLRAIPRSRPRSSSGTAIAVPAVEDRRLEALEAVAQLAVLLLELLRVARELRVALPPVDPHLARLVDRRHEQAQLDREQLDVEQVDLDVARDDDALVEHPLEDVREVSGRLGGGGRAGGVWMKSALHRQSSSTWLR